MDVSDKKGTLRYLSSQFHLRNNPKTWLITGVAGFIGSNLLHALLDLDQIVVGLDSFVTGHQHNLDEIQELVTQDRWDRFTLVRGDIRNIEQCQEACAGVNYVLHHAALGSVPRSMLDPISTNSANITGFLNILVAARDAGVQSFVYAASSSTYGDHQSLPKVENAIGKPLSPYAVTKYVNEVYADVFARCYGFSTIGLRYFNVFGPRQDPHGDYAAVIPKWISALIKREPVFINGDGKTSRDFCFIENIIQMNILASIAPSHAQNHVYNVAVGDCTTLNALFNLMRHYLLDLGFKSDATPIYKEFRSGDVRHSLADISKSKLLLGYCPTHDLAEGLRATIEWYVRKL